MANIISRNPVVAKALNACARNGGIDDFKVGDRVMVRSIVGFTPTDPKPGTVTAIYKSDNRIAVKEDDGGRGLFDASMVTKNACGTARNSDVLSKRFGNVEVLAYEDGRLGIRYVVNLGGFDDLKNAVSWDDAGKKCAAEARSMASILEKKAANVRQAAAWLEQNAK